MNITVKHNRKFEHAHCRSSEAHIETWQGEVMVFRQAAVQNSTDRLDLKTNFFISNSKQMLRDKLPDTGMLLYC